MFHKKKIIKLSKQVFTFFHYTLLLHTSVSQSCRWSLRSVLIRSVLKPVFIGKSKSFICWTMLVFIVWLNVLDMRSDQNSQTWLELFKFRTIKSLN